MMLGIVSLVFPQFAQAYDVNDYQSVPILKAGVNNQVNTNLDTLKATVQRSQNQFSQPPGPGVVGIDFRIHPNELPYVADVFPGTPAFYAGVMPGDRIVAINGQPTLEMTSSDVDVAISDRPGDTVNFTIDHKGQMTSRTVVVMSLALVPSVMIRGQYP